MKRALALLAAALPLLAGPLPAQAAAPCSPGVIEGDASGEDEGAYLLLPFRVAEGVTEVKVRYGWTQPPGLETSPYRTTLDLGLRDPAGYRGWSGSGKGWPGAALDVHGRPGGGERAVRVGPDWATPSYLPGPIPAGEWEVEVGVAALAAGQRSRFTVTVECSTAPAGPAFAAPPIPGAVEGRGPAWYAGDLHVHSSHSEGHAPLPAIADAAAARGLDFVSVTDHNAVSQYAEFAGIRDRHPGLLLLRGTEVTTYHGHANVHGVPAPKEYRAGPVLRLEADGTRTPARDPMPANEIFRAARAAGGLAQINHPSFPTDPVGRNVCRGCGWEFPDTDFALVDAIEVQTGPAGTTPGTLAAPGALPAAAGEAKLGPNPLTPPAIAFWERALLLGHRVTAVGGSDDHTAGRARGLTVSPLGVPTTMVLAEELSERAILDGIRAGRVYVKFWGPDGPSMRLEATGRDGARAGMGEAIAGAPHVAVALGVSAAPVGATLVLVTNAVPAAAVPVGPSGSAEIVLPQAAPGFHYGLVLGPEGILAMTNPVHVRVA